MIRIADFRPSANTLQDACGIFAKVVQDECWLAREKARKAVKIAALNADYEARIAERVTQRDRRAAALKGFIGSHLHFFQKPRKHKAEGGEFGLQKVTELQIDDEAAALEHLRAAAQANPERFAGCVETSYSINKTLLRKAIEAGASVPGCRVKSGDTAVYKVDPALLESEREAVANETA